MKELGVSLARWIGFTWMALAPMVGWLVTSVGWAKEHDVALVVSYTVPISLVGLLGSVRILFNPVWADARLVFFAPRPNRPGESRITGILKAIYREIDPNEMCELRLTLFVPDRRSETLAQFARYGWGDETCVSGTRIRMGTCAVGHAYNRRHLWHIPNVTKMAEYVASRNNEAVPTNALHYYFKWCGLTHREATNHRERAGFAAIPIECQHNGRLLCLAVIAADTGKSMTTELKRDLLTSIGRREQEIVDELKRKGGWCRRIALTLSTDRFDSDEPPSLDPP